MFAPASTSLGYVSGTSERHIMTKAEVLKTVQEAYNELDEFQDDLRMAKENIIEKASDELDELHDRAKRLMKKLEEIPENASEIEDDE
jgi:phosphoserine phosphatase